MKYAGFWVRLAAGLIDFIIFLPLMFLYSWVESYSRTGTLFLVIPYYLFYAGFCIAFLGKYGKTPGKMVMKVVVTSVDGSSIGYREAVLRHLSGRPVPGQAPEGREEFLTHRSDQAKLPETIIISPRIDFLFPGDKVATGESELFLDPLPLPVIKCW